MTECFGTSAAGAIIFIGLLVKDLFQEVAQNVIGTCAWVMAGLSVTGTLQIVFNERWLKPVIRFLEEGERPEPAALLPGSSSRKSSATLIFMAVLLVILVGAVVSFYLFFHLAPAVLLKLSGICLAGGLILTLIFHFLVLGSRAGGVRPQGREVLQSLLVFPLKSAGLSAALWLAFAVYGFVGFRYFLGWRMDLSVYLLLAVSASGIMAFCLQYFLFKATITRHVLPLVSPRIPEGGEIEMVLSIRRKMLISFGSIIVFVLIFTGVLTHYRVSQILGPAPSLIRTEAPGEEKAPPPDRRGPLARFLGHFLIISSLALAISLLASILIANDLSRPLRVLLATARRMERGDLSLQDPLYSEDEIGLLASAHKRLSQGLHAVAEETNQIAQGDLSRRVGGQGDLAKGFNQMVDNLGALVKRIKEASLQVSTSASEILASAREQESGSAEQAASINETMATMEELSSTSRQIADNAESVARVADDTLRAAEEGRKTLSESRQGMEEIRENTQSIADRILRLNEKSKDISVIVDMIDKIADKTDLLALNAALEGSKAGEAGKGFSLVAAEMRKLAVSVVESTKEIKRIIGEIQEAAAAAVQTTEAGLKTTEQGTEMMKRTEGSLERIFTRIRETTDAAKQISFATQQQRSGTEQVVAALDEVSKVSKETIAGNKQATQSATDLAHLSDELRGLVGKFKVPR